MTLIKNENDDYKKLLYYILNFWTNRKSFADRKGWTNIHAIADKQVRIAKKRIRRFKSKKINIPIQLVLNVEKIKNKIEDYNPYTGIKTNTRTMNHNSK